jgi:protein-tyrosine phosphatase
MVPEQQNRLEADSPRSVDIHCHCLPELDDGPATLAEAVALCEALVKDGITTVIATPHQLGRYDRINSAQLIRRAVTELAAELADRDIPLEVYPGGDVRVDERLPRFMDAGEIGTAADAGRHLLLELPHELFVDPTPIIDILRERGLQSIMTHPERHHYLNGSIDLPREWVARGAVLQVTAGSLVGDFPRWPRPCLAPRAGRLGRWWRPITTTRSAARTPVGCLHRLTGGKDAARLLAIDNRCA